MGNPLKPNPKPAVSPLFFFWLNFSITGLAVLFTSVALINSVVPFLAAVPAWGIWLSIAAVPLAVAAVALLLFTFKPDWLFPKKGHGFRGDWKKDNKGKIASWLVASFRVPYDLSPFLAIKIAMMLGLIISIVLVQSGVLTASPLLLNGIVLGLFGLNMALFVIGFVVKNLNMNSTEQIAEAVEAEAEKPEAEKAKFLSNWSIPKLAYIFIGLTFGTGVLTVLYPNTPITSLPLQVVLPVILGSLVLVVVPTVLRIILKWAFSNTSNKFWSRLVHGRDKPGMIKTVRTDLSVEVMLMIGAIATPSTLLVVYLGLDPFVVGGVGLALAVGLAVLGPPLVYFVEEQLEGGRSTVSSPSAVKEESTGFGHAPRFFLVT